MILRIDWDKVQQLVHRWYAKLPGEPLPWEIVYKVKEVVERELKKCKGA